MTVNSYLHSKASSLVLSDSEKSSISTSIATIRTRLGLYFPNEIQEILVFGSYDRGTILPRGSDENSDVDIMVVFADGGYQPQTYLDKIRRFANYYYSSSDIIQSHPTIKISMNHIRFELVPALLTYGNYQIPSPASSYSSWMYTYPRTFKTELQECNQRNKWYIGPTVRLLKRWNATHGRVFNSYELEQAVVNYYKTRYFVEGCNYWTYLREFVDSLIIDYSYTITKRERVTALKNAVAQIKVYLSEGRHAEAESAIRRLIP